MTQTKRAESLNILTHLIGVFIGIYVFKILDSYSHSIYEVVGSKIYALGFILMFLSSSIYHASFNKSLKKVTRLFDHVSIFVFIACSYTVVSLKILSGWRMILLLSIVWTIAGFGLLFKIITFGKYDKTKLFSVIIYLIMGWVCIFFIRPLIALATPKFFIWLLLGGIFYSVGTIFYQKKYREFSHVIWHIFVLLGAISQFIAILTLLKEG